MDPGTVDTLDDLYSTLSASFIRYVVEAAATEVRDDFDRRVFALYEEWARAEAAHLGAVDELLHEQLVHPVRGMWSLECSHFNYLSAAYLLGQVVRRMSDLVANLQDFASRLRSWPEAQRVAEILLLTEQRFLEQVRALEAQAPREVPQPVKAKGTSASRW